MTKILYRMGPISLITFCYSAIRHLDQIFYLMAKWSKHFFDNCQTSFRVQTLAMIRFY